MCLNGDCVLHCEYREKYHPYLQRRITHQAPKFRLRGAWAYCEASWMRGLNTSHKLKTVALDSCPLFRVLRYRTPSSPICLSEAIRKPFASSRVFLLSSGGKSAILAKKKAPPRSGFPYLRPLRKTISLQLAPSCLENRSL